MSDFEMKYIPIFRDIAKLFFSISDEDCGRIVKNLIHYSNGEDVIPFNDPLLDYVLQDSIRRYESALKYCISKSENGKKGGRPKSKTKAKQKLNKSEIKANEKLIESETKANEKHSETYVIRNTNTEYVIEILKYLNEKTGSHFGETKNNVQLITARLNDGYTVEDFKKVIDKKVKAWKSASKMCKFLKPSTLFAPSHFDDYLNEPEERPKSNSFTEMRRADYDMSEMEKRLIKN
jgi:uncharacterized phage protein (TIGR02220 family)